MPQSYTCLHYHLVFGTKYRRPTITPDIQPRLYQVIGGILRARGGQLLAAGGMPDHVHLLASLSKEVSVSSALRDIKSNSSGWIRRTCPNRSSFAWQTGYGAFAVSHYGLDTVKRYIRRQAEHHRKTSFKEEFVASLVDHGIEFNEEYLWK